MRSLTCSVSLKKLIITEKVVLYVLWFGVATGRGHLESGLIGQADSNLREGKRFTTVEMLELPSMTATLESG